MAKLNLLAKAKTLVPKRARRWYEKLPPDVQSEVVNFFDAWKAGELSDNFSSQSEAARYLIRETGTKVSEKQVSDTMTRWGTPNGQPR